MKSSTHQNIRISVGYIKQLVEPVEPGQMAAMPKSQDGIALNPPAWVIGHLAVSMAHVVKMLGGTVDLPQQWSTLFDMKSQPTDEASAYPDKAELLRGLDSVSESLCAALEATTDEQLAAPTPREEFRKLVPTVGDAVTFVGVFHNGLHAGQLTSWRRCMGIGPRF